MASRPLRIPGGKPFNPGPSSQRTAPAAPAPSIPGMDDDAQGGSGYEGPEAGPFECDNCTFFQAPNSCSQPDVVQDPEVAGQVDPKGWCPHFESMAGGSDQTQMPNETPGMGDANATATGSGDSSGYGG